MNYAALITEELAVLQSTEKGQTDARFRDYVRFLRLLKAGEAPTQSLAARQVNLSLSLRQAQPSAPGNNTGSKAWKPSLHPTHPPTSVNYQPLR